MTGWPGWSIHATLECWDGNGSGGVAVAVPVGGAGRQQGCVVTLCPVVSEGNTLTGRPPRVAEQQKSPIEHPADDGRGGVQEPAQTRRPFSNKTSKRPPTTNNNELRGQPPRTAQGRHSAGLGYVSSSEPCLKLTEAASHDGAFSVFQELYEHLEGNKRRKPPQDIKLDPNTAIFELRDLSFQSPVRKKLNLTVSINPRTQKPMLVLSKAGGEVVEFTIDDLSTKNIVFATLLPSSDKAQHQHLVICYRQASSSPGNDPLVCSFSTPALTQQLQQSGKLKGDIELNDWLARFCLIAGFKLQATFPKVNNKSFFVQAYRGTKEGVLYFLPDHVLFGFKKPIVLFQSSEIESIQYSNITRITFSVTLVLKSGDRVEFSMVDQQEFAAIDTYAKGRQVVDMSMSEELKAKPMKNAEKAGALGEAEQEVGADDDDDDEDEDGDYAETGVDDASDVTGSGEEGSGDDDDDDDDDDGDEEAEEEDAEIDLNSDDD